MVAALWGDGQQTYKLGPYERLVRLRKWLYIFAVIVVALRQGWVDFHRVTELAHVTNLPIEIATFAIWSGLGYFCVEYVLVGAQFRVRYREIMYSRFEEKIREQVTGLKHDLDVKRRADDVSRHDLERVVSSRAADVAALEAKSTEGNARLGESVVALQDAKLRLKPGPWNFWQKVDRDAATSRAERVAIKHSETKALVESIAKQLEDARALKQTGEEALALHIASSQMERRKLERYHDALVGQEHSGVQTIRWTEKTIDVMRLLPPLVFGVAVFVSSAESVLSDSKMAFWHTQPSEYQFPVEEIPLPVTQ